MLRQCGPKLMVLLEPIALMTAVKDLSSPENDCCYIIQNYKIRKLYIYLKKELFSEVPMETEKLHCF